MTCTTNPAPRRPRASDAGLNRLGLQSGDISTVGNAVIRSYVGLFVGLTPLQLFVYPKVNIQLHYYILHNMLG
jgi:hypothetical protein